ncbi:hypothetical protein WDW37_08465 [Bdellovibrionota bacterium FG-1]
MDRKELVEKIKTFWTAKRRTFVVGMTGLAVISVTGGLLVVSGKVGLSKHTSGVHTQAKPVSNSPGVLKWVLGTYSEAFESAQEKIESFRKIDVENDRLKLENAHLRLELENKQFSCRGQDASSRTRALEHKLDAETGSAVGRDLVSIQYQVPTNLMPSQLYTLGVSYFKAREDEKAAVILTFLTGMDNDDAFKTPKNYLMTGVSWYRLDNYTMAERYFDQVLKAAESEETVPFQAHARLWKALAANRTGKHSKAQFWLTELIDHHPRSTEAGWVNAQSRRTEVHRGVASEK